MAGATEVRAGGAFVDVGGKLGPLDKALASARSKLQGFASGAIRYGKAFTLVGAAMATPIVLAIEKAGDYAEQLSKFEAVFKELSDPALEWVEALSERLGRSRSDLVMFMATLQDTFVPLGFARAEGLKFAKVLTQLTLDVASFNNKAEPEVLRDFQSALVGNHETVRKYGIIITQATLDQELLNMGIKGGVKQATAQQKVLARMNVIMAGTSDAQGDAARTAGSWANVKRRLFAQIENVALAIGSHLLPVVTPYLSKAADIVKWTAIWIKENRGIVISFVKLTAIILAAGAALIAVGLAAKLLAFLLSPAGGLAIAIAGVIFLLDYFDLIDKGFLTMLGNFKIGATKLEDIWELAMLTLKFLWWSAVDSILEGIQKVIEGWSAMLHQLSDIKFLPQFMKDALRAASEEIKQFGAAVDLIQLWTGGRKEDLKTEMKAKGKIVLEGFKEILKKLVPAAADIPTIPDLTLGGMPGAPVLAGAPAGGVVGTFSGAAAELAAPGTRIMEKQLDELKDQTTILKSMDDKLDDPVTGRFAP